MGEEILKKVKRARKNDTRTAITISDRLDKLQVKVE